MSSDAPFMPVAGVIAVSSVAAVGVVIAAYGLWRCRQSARKEEEKIDARIGAELNSVAATQPALSSSACPSTPGSKSPGVSVNVQTSGDSDVASRPFAGLVPSTPTHSNSHPTTPRSD